MLLLLLTSESVNYMSRYYSRHVDLREVLSKYNPRAAAPLDELSKLCRFPGKLGMDGSQVKRAWESGRADAVRAYCETDVTNTWLLYCRFQLLQGQLSHSAYEGELSLVRDSLADNGRKGGCVSKRLRLLVTSANDLVVLRYMRCQIVDCG